MQPPVAASEYASALQHIPQFAGLGPVFKSAEPLLLTEEETEYNIALVVHVLETHVLLQFNCTNTVAEQVLENVNVVVDLTEAVSATSLLIMQLLLCLIRSQMTKCRVLRHLVMLKKVGDPQYNARLLYVHEGSEGEAPVLQASMLHGKLSWSYKPAAAIRSTGDSAG